MLFFSIFSTELAKLPVKETSILRVKSKQLRSLSAKKFANRFLSFSDKVYCNLPVFESKKVMGSPLYGISY